jgi:hypothetical protein
MVTTMRVSGMASMTLVNSPNVDRLRALVARRCREPAYLRHRLARHSENPRRLPLAMPCGFVELIPRPEQSINWICRRAVRDLKLSRSHRDAVSRKLTRKLGSKKRLPQATLAMNAQLRAAIRS